ncbi:hypothetical protein SCHPADRAFT_946124 [Schizopora paradoxa]|uniref:Zn(2)-C6 fungal-type domain-containing protein n=1 Tax=Schizopora paradoxa TaxID=27342 RepID=A0A0H2R3I5_9AGAM|nr:hypothetical protein SCHPADRAFT_946124 [Schizopora paradoxa]
MAELETLGNQHTGTPKSTRSAKKNRTPCTTCQRLRKRCDNSKGYPCKGCKHKGRLCLRAIKKPRISCSDASLASGQSESVQPTITARAPMHKPHPTTIQDMPGNAACSIVKNYDAHAQAHGITQAYMQPEQPMQLDGGRGSVATYMHGGGPMAGETNLRSNATIYNSYVQTYHGFESHRAEHPTLGGTYSHNAIHNAEGSHPLAQGMPSLTYNAQESSFSQSSFNFGMTPLPGFE